MRKKVRTQTGSFLTFAFYLQNITAFFLPLHSLAYAGLIWDLQDTSISFLGYFVREKLVIHFSFWKSARSRAIINRKGKDLEYYSEKTGELYSGIQNLEMKNDMCKSSTSVKDVNAAALFSGCF